MKISIRDLKILWGRAANRCAICKCELSNDKKNAKDTYPIGEQAHIIAENLEGPRGKSILSAEERASYFNLILLCPKCHTIVDKAPEDYPAERLHMIKHEHEDWVRVSLLGVPSWNTLSNEEKYLLEDNATHIMNFVREWLTFLDFFELFYLKTEAFLESPRGQRKDLPDSDYLQWHKHRGVLRELLFLAGEKNLIVQRIRTWDKLKAEDNYISEWNYDTPFSFILDFVNPTAMINHHGSSVWHSCDISREFIEGLSWKYSSI